MSTVIDLEPAQTLGAEGFEAELMAAIRPYKVTGSRFYQLVASGRCPRRLLLRYAQSAHRGAAQFCHILSVIIARAPDDQARFVLLENLMGEEGVDLTPARGLLVRPERSHPNLALRFVRACGGEADEDASHALGPALEMLENGQWLEPVAFLLIGQESAFAEASEVMFQSLRKYGFSDHDLAFFALHGVADLEHGRQAVEFMLKHARTRELQQRCIAAARAGARHGFELHGGAARE